MNPFSRNLQNVTDPSDWKQTKIPDLSQLDALQRCFICKEFLRAPVITGCNHTFCSHCIREYLVAHSKCPLCQSEQFESNLKRVILLEEIVSCYSSFRPLLLEYLKNDINDEEQTPRGIKRSVETTPEVIEILSDSESKSTPRSSPTTSSPPQKKAKVKSPPPKETILELNPLAPNSPVAPTIKETIPTPKDTVSCPVCSKTMTAEVLQTQHLDECLLIQAVASKHKPSQQPKKKPASISLFFQARKPVNREIPKPKVNHEQFYFNDVKNHKHEELKRLPKVDFNSLTTPKLKEKLSALKLPVQGTRHQLELRYNQYYILFNSNLDSNHPLPEKILKQRLNQWELSHLAFTSSASSSLFSSGSSLSNKSVTDKDFLVKLWMNTYREEFRELVQQARSSIKQTGPAQGLSGEVGPSAPEISPSAPC